MATPKAELVAALVTDKFSGFKDGDEAILEACSDQRLEEFRAQSDQRKAAAAAATRMENDNRNLSARLKVAEDRIKSNEAELTEEEFLARAPASIKEVVETHRAAEAATKASLVTQLKDCGAHTEDELKKMPLDQLRSLASYARVNVPDFSGRGLPAQRNAQDRTNYPAPNPYDEPLKRMREASKH